MTDAALAALYAERQDACKQLGQDARPFNRMNDLDRARIDALSGKFRRIDAAIVRELKDRDAPAVLPGVTLHLTADGLHFVPLQSGTRYPLGMYSSEKRKLNGCLFDYGQVRGARP